MTPRKASASRPWWIRKRSGTTRRTKTGAWSTTAPGTSPALADQIASIAQGDDNGIILTLMAQNQRLQVGIRNAPPSEFKDYSGPATGG